MHRNSQKRIYGEYVYFITCDVQDKIEFFKEEILCEFWIEEMRLAKEIKKFRLFAFCLNYDHFHFLIKPDNDVANYSQIMQFIKRHISRNVNIILGYNKFDLEKMSASRDIHIESDIESDNGNCRSKKPNIDDSDDCHRRLRLREFDEIVLKFRRQYKKRYGNDRFQPKFKWQKSFYDHIIRNEKDYEHHWNYTMNNFLKHNLPKEWKYSGLNCPELIDDIND